MCGIIGYAGSKPCAHGVLLSGLKALEYRGYDSSGIASFQGDQIKIVKAKGKIKELEEKIKDVPESNCGIAHTRWATHGEPNEINAHPHKVEQITLVHNGIIENAAALKKTYEKRGIVFKSDTDSEVACACLAILYRTEKNKLKVLREAAKILKGSYAFGIMFEDEEGVLYGMRKDSPLVLGIGEDGNFLASDLSAFVRFTRKYAVIDENQIVRITNKEIECYDKDLKHIELKTQISEMDISTIEKNGYDSFLLKEIHEEGKVVMDTIHHYMTQSLHELSKTMIDLKKYDHLYFVACGSAYHVGLLAKNLIEKYARIPCNCEVASEFRYNSPILDEKTLVVCISQSGETADTLAALRMVNKMGIDSCAIVNVKGSSLEKEAKYVLPTLAGVEVSVATTKAYCAQVAVCALLALHASIDHLSSLQIHTIEKQLLKLDTYIHKLISDTKLDGFVSSIINKKNVFFIGRGMDYALSMEGALKLKEITYIQAVAYPAGELKHGTISLIEKDTPVMVLISDEHLVDKSISNMKEVKARGAKILLVIREDLYHENIEADEVIFLPKVSEFLQGIVSIVPYQLLAHHIAAQMGCDIDQPKNLAKSVTVE